MDTTSSEYFRIEEDFKTWIRPVAWSPDGTYLAGGGDNGIVYIWSALERRLLQRLQGHKSMITSIVWSPDGTRLASGGNSDQGGELLIWDVETWTCQQTFAGHSEIVSAVAWGCTAMWLSAGVVMGHYAGGM